MKDSKNMLVVIQASIRNERMSDRLWLPIQNHEGALAFLVSRLIREGVHNVVLATTDEEQDKVFDYFANEWNIQIVKGEFYDIPGRLIAAAELEGNENFVRVNATSPLVDIEMMETLFREHICGNYDYSFNEHQQGMIWGTGCDVFRTDFLKSLIEQKLSDNQKESIGQFIRQNVEDARVLRFIYNKKCPGYKLSLDTEKDYEVIKELVRNNIDHSQDQLVEYLNTHPLIANYNLVKPPKETGVEKLFYNPEKVKNIAKKRLPDMSYPISVELTLTNRCNLACSYCSDLELRNRQGVGEQLDLETVKRLFDDLELGGTKGVVLEGGGEPTIYSQFDEVVSYARKKGLAIGLITNGTKVMENQLIKKFEWIRVSLDASTSEEYVDLKGVDAFEKVISNIAKYAEFCDTVGVGYVVTKKNISRIEPLLIRLRDAGVSYVQFRPVVDCPELYPEGVDLAYLKYYENSNFGVMIDGMKDNASSGNHGLPCYAHSITSIISGDGSVYICGRLNIYDWLKPIGNIKEKSFRRIWYGEDRQNQAERLIDGNFCKQHCPQCRISKFNQLFHRLDSVKSVHFI